MADDSLFTRIGKAWRGDESPIGKARAVPTNTIGTNVLNGSGVGGEMVWTDRSPINLVGPQRWDTFEEMLRDISIIAAGVRLFLNLLANAVWTVNPPDDLPEGQQAEADGYAETMYEILFGMTSSWSTVVKKSAGFRLWGFSILEWTALMREDGLIGLLDVEHRPQRSITRWKRDQSGTVESVFQRVLGRAEVELPRGKLVYAVDDTLTDSPEGLGLFRHLAAVSERLRTFLDLEEAGFETDLRGIPIASAPLGELQEEVRKAEPRAKASGGMETQDEATARAEARRQGMLRPYRDFIEKHIRNKKTGVLKPSDTFMAEGDKGTTPSAVPKWGLDLLNGDSQSFEAIAAAIKELKQDLARILGVEHLLLGSDGAGSLALARSKVGTFYLTVTSTLLDLVEVFDRDLIAPVADLNGWPEELWPEMGVNEISDRDIEQVMDALSKLAAAGAPMLPDDPAVGELYDLLGLARPPERTDEMDVSLNPGRRDPQDPDKPMEGDPEEVKKRRVLKSRRRRKRRA